MSDDDAPLTPLTPLTPLSSEAIDPQIAVQIPPWAARVLEQWRDEKSPENLRSPKTPDRLPSAEDQHALSCSYSSDQSSEGGTPTWKELKKDKKKLWRVGTHVVLRPRDFIPKPARYSSKTASLSFDVHPSNPRTHRECYSPETPRGRGLSSSRDWATSDSQSQLRLSSTSSEGPPSEGPSSSSDEL